MSKMRVKGILAFLSGGALLGGLGGCYQGIFESGRFGSGVNWIDLVMDIIREIGFDFLPVWS